MLYENITPPTYVEKKSCREIFDNLSPFFDNDTVLYVRAWDQEIIYPKDKYFITIITSAEGHLYVPQESVMDNCLGVFMHYYPKENVDYQFDPNHFLTEKNLSLMETLLYNIDKIHPLPLGVTDFFTGCNSVPIIHRPINVAFVGQLDPYRRLDFYNNIAKIANTIDNSVFHFYQGWNNGIGEKYSEIMSNTKIALVPCGSASLDTFRYYEAAKCGCVIVCENQNNYEFMAGATHIKIDDWAKIGVVLNSLLSGPAHLNKTSNNTHKFWHKRLSPSAAADFILRKLGT